ncbi:translation factor SUA5 [Rhizobium sp. RU20A]|uniref:L-threonylcarbamoyladenylate synthase n=1 Tax=Rhizobium sp. RU20A TaxID=1907412 RepID=UPI0009551C25|nr:L-threonylcarbamoyladenylate synthase [Rhizobium sp. RU20A]SIR08929.1 translation factor SUA5 [Rhizobium sp. RU20A]
MARIIDVRRDPDGAIAAALDVLSRRLPVAIPTETVYGLAADATEAEAVTRIYEVKGRPRFNPLIAHVADLAMAEQHAVFDPVSRQLADRFWPGPLTLVLPLKADSTIHPLATAGLDTVAMRMPDGFSRRVIAALGRPLSAPSANTSGRISPTSAQHVEADLGARIELILDAGACVVGLESTIVKVEDGRIRLLRPGGLDAAEIEAATGIAVERPETSGAAIVAPGMLASHYAPDAPVRLEATHVEPGEALIRFGPEPVAGEEMAHAVFNLSPGGDLREAAAALFDMMKRADASGARRIVFGPIPRQGLGEAIHDRIERAAAPRA